MKPLNKNKLRSIEITLITLGIIILMGASFFAGIQICKLYNELRYFNFSYVDSINSAVDPVVSQELVEVSEPDGDEATSTVGIIREIKNARISAYSKFDEGVNCVSASQKNICWLDYGVIACPNSLEFFTKVKIDDKEYTCLDKMNSYHRGFDDHFDIWFDDDLDSAIQFGIQYLDVEIIE